MINCRTGERPKTYKKYLDTRHWHNIRESVLNRDEHRCVKCSIDVNLLAHVHHLTYERIGNEFMDDLITLCPNCHNEIHKDDVKKIEPIKLVPILVPSPKIIIKYETVLTIKAPISQISKRIAYICRQLDKKKAFEIYLKCLDVLKDNNKDLH